MALVTRFEDLEAWRQSRMLVRDIYAVTNYPRFSRDYGLRDQIRRAAVSIMSNIAEGFERGGAVEFRRFLAIAKGSAGEVRAQLYVALDSGLIDKAQFQKLHNQSDDVTRLIGGLMRYLSRSPDATS